MKKYIFLVIILFTISMAIGYYYGERIFNNTNIEENVLEVKEENNKQINDTTSIETVSKEIKVLPSTKFGIRKKYEACNHTSFEFVELPEETINKTKEELSKMYPGWNIDEFFENKIILSKEFEGICEEHFVMTIGEEYVEIYRLLDENKNKALYKITDISIKYLPKEDIEKLKEGILIYGKDKLNSAIEDFE